MIFNENQRRLTACLSYTIPGHANASYCPVVHFQPSSRHKAIIMMAGDPTTGKVSIHAYSMASRRMTASFSQSQSIFAECMYIVTIVYLRADITCFVASQICDLVVLCGSYRIQRDEDEIPHLELYQLRGNDFLPMMPINLSLFSMKKQASLVTELYSSRYAGHMVIAVADSCRSLSIFKVDLEDWRFECLFSMQQMFTSRVLGVSLMPRSIVAFDAAGTVINVAFE